MRLLKQHGSLGDEQIAALLGESASDVRSALTDLRGSGLVAAVTVGAVQVHTADSASYWWLTAKGVRALERGDWTKEPTVQ
jgi:DeoR/GlpR family transcriptional regulator of sugar metabolism